MSTTDYIHVTGSWVGDSKVDPYFEDFAIQTSEISCHKERRVCSEARAIWHETGILSSLLDYEIREWTTDRVVAVLEGAAATIELSFDVKKKVVLLTHNEKAELPSSRKLPDHAHPDDGFKAIEKVKRK